MELVARHFTGRSVDRSVDGSVDRSVGRSVGRSVDGTWFIASNK